MVSAEEQVVGSHSLVVVVATAGEDSHHIRLEGCTGISNAIDHQRRTQDLRRIGSVAPDILVVQGRNWASAARSLVEEVRSLVVVVHHNWAAVEGNLRVAGRPDTAGPERKTWLNKSRPTFAGL